MINHNHTTIEEKRQCMRNLILTRIQDRWHKGCSYAGIFTTFAEFGLNHKKAGKEFLNSHDWSDTTLKQTYLEEIQSFLRQHLK